MKYLYLTSFLILLISSKVYSQTKDEFFVKTWTGWVDDEKINFTYLHLTKTGQGYTCPGMNINGQKRLAPHQLTDLQDWQVRGDTLILKSVPLPVDSEGNTAVWTIRYIIIEKGKDFFIANYYDPKLDAMMAEAGEKVEAVDVRFEEWKR